MIYELRRYEVAQGRMDELIERFNLHTIRLFKKHGITPVMFLGVSETSPNIFSYFVSFSDRAAQKDAWNSFIEDRERVAIWDESNKNGKLVTDIQSDNYLFSTNHEITV